MNADYEKALLDQCLQQPEAFRELYRHYAPKVFAYAAYRVGSREDAEDVVAEIFLKVVENLHSFEYRGDGSFSAWVFRIAYNQVIQHFRKHKQPTLPLDELPEIQADMLPLSDSMTRQELFAHLRELIATLSPRRQEIITLKFFGKLPNRQIADILNLDERTVASHLCRALDDLQQIFTREAILNQAY